MGGRCRGECEYFERASKPRRWWQMGVKRCSTCDYYLKTDMLSCECCNNKLSTRPVGSTRHQIDVKRIA